MRRFFRRLAGARGEGAVELAGKAVRAVALGVVVTALVQTTLAGVGLAVAGIPHAGLLTAIVLVLCIAQVGPLLVMAGAVIWLYATGSSVWGTVLLVWSVGVVSIDNILRPVLIKKGADLPLLLIFAGVIGGLISFGVVGLFIGPAVLAVAYTLTSFLDCPDGQRAGAGRRLSRRRPGRGTAGSPALPRGAMAACHPDGSRRCVASPMASLAP